MLIIKICLQLPYTDYTNTCNKYVYLLYDCLHPPLYKYVTPSNQVCFYNSLELKIQIQVHLRSPYTDRANMFTILLKILCVCLQFHLL
jgi:hypothetical protein